VPIVPELLLAKVRVFADLFRKTRQLELLDAELERCVEERTTELTRANAELERRVEAGGIRLPGQVCQHGQLLTTLWLHRLRGGYHDQGSD
jgi:C4-dicarboxylate-specific signal transduction histidine kinase